MKKLYLFLLLTFTSCFSFAQKNLVPGFVVLAGGDTIVGKLDNRDWEALPEKINFVNSRGETKVYFPKDIQAFWSDPKEVYLSKRLAMDVSPVMLADLLVNSEQKIVRDTLVFVKLLVRGDLNLYFSHDGSNKDHFWVQKANDTIIELTVDRKAVINSNYEKSIYTLDKYKIFLPGIMSDCPSMEPAIKNADFTKSSLSGLVNRYNKCINPQSVDYTARETKTKFRFGIIAGPSLVKLKFEAEESIPIGSTDFNNAWTYSLGGAMKIILPYLNGSLIIYNDFIYQPFSVEDSVRIYNILPHDSYNNYFFSFRMGYLKLNTMFRYQYPRWKIKPFINIGISQSYAIIDENSLITEMVIPNPNTVETTYGVALEETRKYEFGVLAGAGAVYHGFGLELRYETANGMSPYVSKPSSVNSFSLMLSYTFGEN